MLVFAEPYHETGGITLNFVPEATAIEIMRNVARHMEKKHITDDCALVDFTVTHWTETIEQMTDKMAKAMWDRFHQGSGGEAAAVAWEQVLRDPWREQAKAALRALGVPIP